MCLTAFFSKSRVLNIIRRRRQKKLEHSKRENQRVICLKLWKKEIRKVTYTKRDLPLLERANLLSKYTLLMARYYFDNFIK